MRRRIVSLVPALLLIVGCGGKFDLPTEHPAAKAVPSDKSYAMLQTWKGMDGIQDILVTQGQYSQLFLLFNHTYPAAYPDAQVSGRSLDPRGEVRLFPFANPVPVDESYFPRPKTLFNPVAICAGQGRLFVLDAGDSCIAKWDDARGSCDADPRPQGYGGPDTHPDPDVIRDYRATWRVREYAYNDATGGRYTGDTTSTFTDTSFVEVYGIAADPQGRVYVSGLAAQLDTSQVSSNSRERKFAYRLFRYARGIKPGYGGLVPEELNWDVNMPGSGGHWYRDTTWFSQTGTGTGFIIDPRGMAWVNGATPGVLVADRGNNAGKVLSPYAPTTGYFSFDGTDIPPPAPQGFSSPEAAKADLQGYLYLVDRGNQRAVRYDPFGRYVQTINVELNSDILPLLDPNCLGVDDSVAYVGDRGRNQVIRYKRRP